MTLYPETLRICRLIDDLREARWKRIAKSPNPLDELLADEDYPPQGDEEKAIWVELTAPRNYKALRRYVALWNVAKITRYVSRFHGALLEDSTRHMPHGG